MEALCRKWIRPCLASAVAYVITIVGTGLIPPPHSFALLTFFTPPPRSLLPAPIYIILLLAWLQEQIKANIDEEFHILGREANAFDAISLWDMTTILQCCDEKCKLSNKHQQDIAEEVFQSSKLANNSAVKENHLPNPCTQSEFPSSSTHCPKLTNKERELISKYEGC